MEDPGIVWVNGVDESGGWHDANKVNGYDGEADDNMCYAASAANLIAWWQENSNLTSSAPKGSDNIWKMKGIQRNAYNFRNFENYRLRVLAACSHFKEKSPSHKSWA